jgi:hypothetical protein
MRRRWIWPLCALALALIVHLLSGTGSQPAADVPAAEGADPPARVASTASVESEAAEEVEPPIIINAEGEEVVAVRSWIEPHDHDHDHDDVAAVDSEQVVDSRLDWLSRHQSDDGSWSVANRPRYQESCGREWGGEPHRDVGRTALALLALTSSGHTHRQGSRKRLLARAVKWLKIQQQREGWIGRVGGSDDALRNHALATLALAELYASSRDFTLNRYLRKAARVCEQELAPQLEWPAGDAAGRGWLVLALRACREAEMLEDAAAVAEQVGRMVDLQLGAAPGGPQDLLVTRDGVVALLGRLAFDPSSWPGGKGPSLAESTPSWPRTDLEIETQLVRAVGLRPRRADRAWYAAWIEVVLKAQEVEGCEAGSWSPVRGLDRVETTALATLSLDVCYRARRRGD